MDSGVTQRILKELKISPKQLRDNLRYFVGSGDGHRYWCYNSQVSVNSGLAREEAERMEGFNLREESPDCDLQEGEGIPVRVIKG